MKTALDKKFRLIHFIWASCQIIGALSEDNIETATIPPNMILEKLRNANGSEIRQILNNTRRILSGRESTHNRPYMVYLKLPANNAKYKEYRRWLCGGVIIHEEYILTSAACIEDVKHFYVVAGTYKFSFEDNRYNNPCIKNGAKKAVWKCIPRNYVFDGHENDNVRWMNNDIAIVKLEDEYDFSRRVRGCDYAPRPICYNNQSSKYEEDKNYASIAGWGSTEKYNDWVNTRRNEEENVQALLEAPVEIIDKETCRERWGHRYYNIINNYMICTRDLTSEVSEICQEKYVDCTDIVSDSEEEVDRRSLNPENMSVHSSYHNYSLRKHEKIKHGGFCENDHGGPLVYGDGVNAVVIGIISACLVKERTNKCYGPFLYTSVYKNRKLIDCAIYKDVGAECNKLFRASVTHTETELNWIDHPDGPAKSEIKAMRRKEEEEKRKQTVISLSLVDVAAPDVNATKSDDNHGDSPLQHAGVIVRTHDENDDAKTALKAKIEEVAATDNKTVT